MPRRARSDSNNDQATTDTTPKLPARTPLDDDDNIDHGNRYKQPDVWATPTTNNNNNSSSSNGKTVASTKRWKVKRVWYVDEIDEQEREHEVESSELMNKVKELLGVPTASSTAEAEYDPTVSNWKVKKVIDVEGRVQEESKTQIMDETEVLVNMTEMEKDYREVNGKWAYHEDDEGQEEEGGTDWQVPEFVEHKGQEEIQPPNALKEAEQEKEISTKACDVDKGLKTEPMQATSSKPPMTPRKEKKKKDKKKKAEDDEYGCIFNLLSPPPVTLIGTKLSSDS
jgi:hypothetical protein